MKRTNSILMVAAIATFSIFSTGCSKEQCFQNEQKQIQGSFKMNILDKDKQVVLVKPETKTTSGDAKRKSPVRKAGGELIAEGIDTLAFYVSFNAVLNKSGAKGEINWDGTDFGQTKLDITFLNIEGQAAVVGGIVKAYGWYFPKGTYIAFLVRDNGSSSQFPDQLNHSLYYSGTDSGEWLTPSSDFWSSGWYTLTSQLSVH